MIKTVAATSAAAPTPDEGALTAQDRAIIDQVSSLAAQGKALKAWWDQVESGSIAVDRFDLIAAQPGFEATWGFFAEAPILGQDEPVMGVVQDFFFDQPRVAKSKRKEAADWMFKQVREYALGYNVGTGASSWNPPQAYPDLGRLAAPRFLQGLGWCPPAGRARAGAGMAWLYYKLLKDGRVGKFPNKSRDVTIDLREIGKVYEWIVQEGYLYNAPVTLGVAGSDLPKLVLQIQNRNPIILIQELIADQIRPQAGVLGQFGYGLLPFPAPGGQGSRPKASLGLQYFRVLGSGEVRMHRVNILNRSDQVSHLSLDPIDWSFRIADLLTLGVSSSLLQPLQDALKRLPLQSLSIDPVSALIAVANLLSAGRAASELCYSMDQVHKEILLNTALLSRNLVLGGRLTWDQVPNWLDQQAIPEWVVREKP